MLRKDRLTVVLVDADAVSHQQGMGVIRKSYAQSDERKSMTQGKVDQFLGNMTPSATCTPCPHVTKSSRPSSRTWH